jgi:hypothetical protein
MSDSRIIQKMKKLMAMAEGNANENEAMTAARQLQILLAKHNISMSELDTPDEEKEQIESSSESHKCRPWKRVVALSIARLYFCEMYFTRMGNGKSSYFFVGTETNRNFAMQIFSMVVKSIEKDSRKQSKEIYGKEDSSFVNSFWSGAMHRISERCAEMIEEAKRGEIVDDNGANLPALVSVYEENNKRVSDFLSKTTFKSASSNTRATNSVGISRGKAAGDRVQLNRGIGGSATKHIGG